MLYILFDPQCPHCGQLWTELKDVNNVNINWIPVAFMNNKSLGQGAYILQSSSPINAMIEHERLMDEKKGGIITGEIKDDFKAKIETNNVFFKKNFQGVPVLLIKNKQEQFLFTKQHKSSTMRAILNKQGGIMQSLLLHTSLAALLLWLAIASIAA